MRLLSVELAPSPERPGHTRLSGTIEFAPGEPEVVWYEVSDEFADGFSETANPWLLVMLPYALERGGTIETDLPADPMLLENLGGIIAILRDWYPRLKPVEIEARAVPPTVMPDRTASFFSGGIDSWFTALRHSEQAGHVSIGHVDDFITVWGFDVPLTAPGEFNTMMEALRPAAEALDKSSVQVTTNLRAPRSIWSKQWGTLTHGAGLASVGLALEKRYRTLLIGSSHSYDKLIHWGSHPMIDPLFSTMNMRVVHDGAPFNRVEKTILVSNSDLALSKLRVCWARNTASNCCLCEKCYRTMATLEISGALQRCPAFPRGFSLEMLGRTYASSANERDFLLEVAVYAEEQNRLDIAAAIRTCLRRSAWLRPVINWAESMQQLPVLWRIGRPVRRALLSGRPT
jgi:hypothetical protein